MTNEEKYFYYLISTYNFETYEVPIFDRAIKEFFLDKGKKPDKLVIPMRLKNSPFYILPKHNKYKGVELVFSYYSDKYIISLDNDLGKFKFIYDIESL